MQLWMDEKYRCETLTGMGIDKANVRTVNSFQKVLEVLSRRAGRAGRNGEKHLYVCVSHFDGINAINQFISVL
jgi:superfamily II DNA helicase RecQ